MSKIVTSRVVYNINYKNKIEKMRKLSTFSVLYPTTAFIPSTLTAPGPWQMSAHKGGPWYWVRYVRGARCLSWCTLSGGDPVHADMGSIQGGRLTQCTQQCAAEATLRARHSTRWCLPVSRTQRRPHHQPVAGDVFVKLSLFFVSAFKLDLVKSLYLNVLERRPS